MKKNKGMKIYKQRKKKRGSNSQILSILGTVAVVFGVGIFGYYVVAVPIYELVKSMGESPDTITTQTSEADIQVTEAVTTTYQKIIEDLKVNTEAVVTIAPVTSSAPVTSAVTSETTAVTTVTEKSVETAPAVVTTAPPVVVKGGCYYLTVSDLSSLSSLTDKLNSIEGFSSVAIPLKTTGGSVNYSSSVNTASLSGAVSDRKSVV